MSAHRGCRSRPSETGFRPCSTSLPERQKSFAMETTHQTAQRGFLCGTNGQIHYSSIRSSCERQRKNSHTGLSHCLCNRHSMRFSSIPVVSYSVSKNEDSPWKKSATFGTDSQISWPYLATKSIFNVPYRLQRLRTVSWHPRGFGIPLGVRNSRYVLGALPINEVRLPPAPGKSSQEETGPCGPFCFRAETPVELYWFT